MGTRLEGKTALVTGATSNIGKAIAVAFGAEGAHVVVSGRSHERGAEVVDWIRAGGGRAEFVAADLDGSPTASTKLATEATPYIAVQTDAGPVLAAVLRKDVVRDRYVSRTILVSMASASPNRISGSKCLR